MRIKEEPKDEMVTQLIEQVPAHPKKVATRKPRTKAGIKRARSKPMNRVCCMCGASIEGESEMRMHIRTAHPFAVPEDKDLTGRHNRQCHYCQRKYRTKQFVANHFKVFPYVEPVFVLKENAKDLMCSICGMTKGDKKGLEIHEAVKHGIGGQHPCGFEGCKKIFAHATLLDKHRHSVHSEKKYVCDVCGRGFTIFRAMKQHAMVHLDKKPFQCNQCEKSFSLERVLEAHIIAIHSGIE